MPVISYFFGIYIRMYHADHPPAHFHAEYQGHEAFVSIETFQSKQAPFFRATFPQKPPASFKNGPRNTRRNCLKTGQKRVISNPCNAFLEPTMIKIVKAEHLGQHRIHLTFSDGKQGAYDMAPLLEKKTVLTQPLQDTENFKDFYLELGALCWKNGLELSPSAIYQELQTAEKLSSEQHAA